TEVRRSRHSIKRRSLNWVTSSAPDTKGGTSAVVAHNENPDNIADGTKQEMIRGTVARSRGGDHGRESEKIPASQRPAACNVAIRRKIHQQALSSQSARNTP